MVKIECTNQNIKDALGKYANEPQDDWDLNLQAVVYGINIAKQVRVFLWKPLSDVNCCCIVAQCFDVSQQLL